MLFPYAKEVVFLMSVSNLSVSRSTEKVTDEFSQNVWERVDFATRKNRRWIICVNNLFRFDSIQK